MPAPTSPAPAPSALLAAVRDAAAQVAAYLHEVSGAQAERELKRDVHDIVTVHDRRSEEIAVEVLRRHVPTCRVLGEEGGLDVVPGPGGEDGEGAAAYPSPPELVTFVVDPIDGTSNFAAGLPIYCTSIAAQVGDATVAAVVRMPELGLEVFADDDACWVQELPLDGTAPRVPAVRVPGPVARTEIECNLSTGYPATRDLAEDADGALAAYAELGRLVGALRSIGAGAAELALVAAGRLDATLSTRTTPWDVAAGAHLVARAGGNVEHLVMDGDPQAPPIHMAAYLAVGPGREVPGVRALMDRLSAERRARVAGGPAAGSGDGDAVGGVAVPADLVAGYRVDRARESDLPAIAAVLADDVLGAGRESADLAPYARALRLLDDDPRHLVAVVRDEADAVVGTVQLTVLPGMSRAGTTRLQVEGVRLAPSVRGSGVGSALLSWAEDWGRAQGATLAQLTADATRTDAHRFYERAGYVPSHVGLKKPLPLGDE